MLKLFYFIEFKLLSWITDILLNAIESQKFRTIVISDIDPVFIRIKKKKK